MHTIRFFLMLLICFCSVMTVSAQSNEAQPPQLKAKLTEKSIVKDSSGHIYPYVLWTVMIRQDHVIRPIDPGNPDTEFLLVKLSPEELDKRRQKREEQIMKMPRPPESKFFRTGEKLGFKTRDMNNHPVDLKELKGRIVVLNFWFINCGPCRREIPELNELVDSFQKDSVVFLGIALDGKDELEKFLQHTPFLYTIIDQGRHIADKFGVKSYPTHAVLDKEGKVFFHTMGLAPNTVIWIRKSIMELMKKG